MMFFLILVVVGTGAWVYVDAQAIGVKKGQIPGFFDMGPVGWMMSCILIWVVAFPLYLSRRSQYINIISRGPEKAPQFIRAESVSPAQAPAKLDFFCPSCKTHYVIAKERIPSQGAVLTCKVCSERFPIGSTPEDLIPTTSLDINHTSDPSQSRDATAVHEAPVASGSSSGLAIAGKFLLVIGLIGAGYFFLFFDVSVEVPVTTIMGQKFGGGRVANLSLMSQQQNGIIISLALAALGGLLIYLGRNQKSPTADQYKKCPFCAESIKAEAKICRFCGREQPES